MSVRFSLKILLIALAYFLAAKLGLKLAIVHPSATAVWPPTGITLTLFLFLGYGIWPGIFLGAFAANLLTAGTITTSLGIAVGNTLEGLLGAYLINELANGRHAFNRSSDIFKFVIGGALVSTMVSATFGVTSLVLGGAAPWPDYGPIWLTWWLGDAMGDLIVAPVLILWCLHPRLGWSRQQRFEGVLLILTLCLFALVTFGGWYPSFIKNYPVEIVCIPFVFWAAFRFGQREAATTSLVLCGIALWGALCGFGPFVQGKSLNETILLLQVFMGVISMMGVIVGTEVSKRKQAEEALRVANEELERRVEERTHWLQDSEERFHLLVEGVKEYAIFMLDSTGHIVSWNAGAERIKGYRAEEIIGKHVSVFYPLEDVQRGKPELELKDAVMKGSVENEGWRIRKDGSRFWANVVMTALFDSQGSQRGFVKVTHDITERKRTEEALLKSEARFQRVLESNIIGFMIVDFQGKVLEANDAFLNMLGYTREELKAGKIGGSDMTPPEYRHLDEWAQVRLSAARYCPPFEKEYIRKDGSRWPVLVGVVRLDEPEPHDLCFLIDVTERRQAQKALQKSYDELEQRVEERTQDLSRVNADLEKEVALRKRAETKLKSLSLHDELTGLYNRRGFLALAEQHLLQARRDRKPFLFFFSDVDGLKQINDTLGHVQGDQALIKVADILRETFRKSDVLARVGGDEFAMVATTTEGDRGQADITRLRQNLQRANTEYQFLFLLSLSIGVAVFIPGKESTLQELMIQADRDLYRYKRSHHLTGVNVIRS